MDAAVLAQAGWNLLREGLIHASETQTQDERVTEFPGRMVQAIAACDACGRMLSARLR